MKRTIIFSLGLTACLLLSYCNSDTSALEKTNDPNKDGFVPNQETAIRIAEAVWLPIYGKMVLDEKPYIATLMNDSIWIVQGTVHTHLGGAAYLEIRKKDCKIKKVTHFK